MLRLVRELKRVGATEDDFLRPLMAACDGLGIHTGDATSAVSDVWRESIGAGEDTLTRAAGEAIARPLAFPGVPAAYRYEPSHRQVLTLAYLLELHHGERPGFFPFGASAIGQRLDLHRLTVGRVIRRMDREGLARLQRDFDGKPSWDYSTGDSYAIRYTGPQPVEAGSDAT